MIGHHRIIPALELNYIMSIRDF